MRTKFFIGLTILICLFISIFFVYKNFLQLEIKKSKYPWHHNVLATQFYIGETSNSTAWDIDAVKSYGGVDDPTHRNGYYPASFIPKQNPFYFALPYSDLTSDGKRRDDAKLIPWYDINLDKPNYSFVKNRWIEVKYKNRTAYAQWEDCLTPFLYEKGEIVGYGGCEYFNYVFGNDAPTYPGIDISPALSDYLGMNDTIYGHKDDYVSWRFVDEEDVPPGPWKEIITTSQVNW